ncbi:MAG: hypothetical protein IEMM0008_0962 [bacterium]|nr:MAG: hypothetical protein IEMM0008_0962 [bacterium]
MKIENLSLKKANSDANYNQIDKRSVNVYQEMWRFDDDIAFWLKLFTGENNIKLYSNLHFGVQLRNEKRIFFDEMPNDKIKKIVRFFKKNKILVVSDLLKGRGGLSANWILVTKWNKSDNTTTWILKDINYATNFFGGGEVKISPKGSLSIGRITMQRKGGTPDPTKLQFKIKPCDLFLEG